LGRIDLMTLGSRLPSGGMAKLSKRGRIIAGAVVGLFIIGGIQNAVSSPTSPSAAPASTPTTNSSPRMSAHHTSSATTTESLRITSAVVVTPKPVKAIATTASTTAPMTANQDTATEASTNPKFAAATARCKGSAGPDVIEWALWQGTAAEGTLDPDILYPNPSDPSGPCLSAVDVFFSGSTNLPPGTCLEVAYASDNPQYAVNYTVAAMKPKKPFRKAGDSCG